MCEEKVLEAVSFFCQITKSRLRYIVVLKVDCNMMISCGVKELAQLRKQL